MEIRIDTKKDTSTEIKHAIEFLQRFIDQRHEPYRTTSETQEFSVPTNMFDSPVTVTEDKQPEDEFKILEY